MERRSILRPVHANATSRSFSASPTKQHSEAPIVQLDPFKLRRVALKTSQPSARFLVVALVLSLQSINALLRCQNTRALNASAIVRRKVTKTAHRLGPSPTRWMSVTTNAFKRLARNLSMFPLAAAAKLTNTVPMSQSRPLTEIRAHATAAKAR
jgi:hypothetical protein